MKEPKMTSKSSENFVLIFVISFLLVAVVVLFGVVSFLVRRIYLTGNEMNSRELNEKVPMGDLNTIVKQNGVSHVAYNEKVTSSVHISSKPSLNGNVLSHKHKIGTIKTPLDDNRKLQSSPLLGRFEKDHYRQNSLSRMEKTLSFGHQDSGDLSPCSDKLSSTTESDATGQSRNNSLTNPRIQMIKSESIIKDVVMNHQLSGGSPMPLRLTGTLMTPTRRASPSLLNNISHTPFSNHHNSYSRPANFGIVKETDLLDEIHHSFQQIPSSPNSYTRMGSRQSGPNLLHQQNIR